VIAPRATGLEQLLAPLATGFAPAAARQAVSPEFSTTAPAAESVRAPA